MKCKIVVFVFFSPVSGKNLNKVLSQSVEEGLTSEDDQNAALGLSAERENPLVRHDKLISAELCGL